MNFKEVFDLVRVARLRAPWAEYKISVTASGYLLIEARCGKIVSEVKIDENVFNSYIEPEVVIGTQLRLLGEKLRNAIERHGR